MQGVRAGVSCVAVEGSTGTMVTFAHDAWATMLAASGSKRILNSRRGVFTNSRAKSSAERPWAEGFRPPPQTYTPRLVTDPPHTV